MKTMETEVAEQATGCTARGELKLYAGNINRKGLVSRGDFLFETKEDLQDWILAGGSVNVPGAGAGSYRQVFEAMGYKVEAGWNQCSSAGDWSFILNDGDYYMMGFQDNNYPRAGFSYSVDHNWQFDSKSECERFAQEA